MSNFALARFLTLLTLAETAAGVGLAAAGSYAYAGLCAGFAVLCGLLARTESGAVRRERREAWEHRREMARLRS